MVPTFVYLLVIWFPFRVIANISLLLFSFTIYLLLKFSIIISGHWNMSSNGAINIYLRVISTKLATEWKLCGVSNYLLNLEVLCSNTFAQPPWPLAQAWRSQVAKNIFLWVELTHKNFTETLGILRIMLWAIWKSYQWLGLIPHIPSHSTTLCINMRPCLHQIESSYHCSNTLRPHGVKPNIS